jgi:hypothetical protein
MTLEPQLPLPFDRGAFKGARALITGGMGFIGSNLAIALVEMGADVTIADAMIPGYGGNLFNVEPIRDRVTVNFCDIRDVNVMNYLVRGQDFVFHLAGQMDHVLSLTDPSQTLRSTSRGRRSHGGVQTSQSVGPRHSPGRAANTVRRFTARQRNRADSPERRLRSNLTAEKIVEFYNDVHHIHGVAAHHEHIRAAAQMRHSRYGVVNWSSGWRLMARRSRFRRRPDQA